MSKTGIKEAEPTTQGGQCMDHIGRLRQASVKGLEKKLSVHPDLSKTLRNIIHLSLPDSCPPSSLVPAYHGGSLCFCSLSDMPIQLYKD